jgi:hypothetical protein
MIGALLSNFAAGCPGGGSFLGFPTWYEYLPYAKGTCDRSLQNLSDIWLIIAAVIEIMLRIAAIVAVIFVIYGAISYVTSQGEPDKTAKARDTIVNALVGLAIAVTSAGIVAFIAGRVT